MGVKYSGFGFFFFDCTNEKRPFKAVYWNRVKSIVVGHAMF